MTTTIRSGLIALTVAAVVAAAAVAATTAEAATGVALAASVEDEGADCAVSSFSTINNAQLPDPFTRINGTRISTTADWRCRRAEIREMAETYVYGQKPAKPATVTGSVSTTSITANVSDQGKSTSFSASVQLPSTGTAPYPAVFVLAGVADTATILASGAAVINYNPLTVGAEGTSRSAKSGAFYTLYGSTSTTGLEMAWAWGVSRLIDVIEQSGTSILRADGLGVTGCSRYGKGAFTIGVFDQRIALTMPIESGSGGVPAFRSIPGESGSQPLSSAYNEQPWLGDAFGSFTSNPNALPVDTHEMVAMIAPRGLFIMENPHIDWLAAKSGSVAALGGAEVYKALGAGDNITYWSDVSDGTHCANRSEWKTPLQQNIQKFLLRTGNAAGSFHISSKKAGNLSQWRTWTTPTLTSGATTSPTTVPTTTPPTTTPTTPPASGACSATVSLNSWTGGYVATVRVTAGSTALTGWSVGVTLPGGSAITNTWNATATGSSGTVSFRNVSYNGSVTAGASTEFGFQGTGTGPTATPTCQAG
ncbi:hypothetical protein GCM10010112_83330 [Actinoplanes lobatus]|uniref:CBM2 domain-containing protein n=1 Tax=Actinoplanes lobatus TaxID=113568 RepID=A0A7W7HKT1_9ACTN|nr:cellulose binding domain-containing protein [Actinoplanes lobatus]MBB4752290.1 hypothetical protein [Actinoplanes lobatus]GGN94225.1 hypothetical protein GCM10010112_83330 [Actinoplanes lobatus]GIE45725.1 hypothetical protein Alo02nite_86230 [Actinoplanes lobatus]